MQEYRLYGKPDMSDDGKNLVLKMNENHKPMAEWAYNFINLNSDYNVLDIGCGGGVNIKYFAEKTKCVYGIDHSLMACTVAGELNQALLNNKVFIRNADILSAELDDIKFDVITAFETIYFWKYIDKEFLKIKSWLKHGGRFYLVFTGIEDQKTWPFTPGANLISEYDIIKKLVDSGFRDVHFYLHDSEAWMLIEVKV